MDLAGLVRLLRCPEAEVHSVFRCGSRVYGTATPESDEDFVAVLSRPGQKQDLAFAPGVNVVVHGVETFGAALANHSIFALECWFAPPQHRIREGRPAWSFKLDRSKLAEAAIERSDADFAKSARRFADEPGPSRKRLFHALRVPLFALQIARHGRLVDYAEANPLWRRIEAEASTDWDVFLTQFGPVRDEACRALRKAAGSRG